MKKMTREKLIESLKEVGNIILNSKQVKDILPEMYGYFVHVFRFMEEDLKKFLEGGYLIKICFLPDRVTFTVGKDVQRLPNEPYWMEDCWDVFKTEELVALLKAAK